MTIRKVFLAPLNHDHQQVGMIQAFTGIFGKDNVRTYDYLTRLKETNWGMEYVQDEIYEQIVQFKPDWAWFQFQNTNVVSSDTVGRMREKLPQCVFSHWTGDVRERLTDYFVSILKATHMTFAANVGFLEKYREAGAKETVYVAHGLDWDEDVQGLPEWEPPFRVPDVVFCGNHYGDKVVGSPEREAGVRTLHEAGINIGIVGGGWEKTGLPVLGTCAVKQQVHVYRRAKAVLVVNHYPDLAGYHGDRTIIAMASGTPAVARHFPGLENEFLDGTHLLVYRTPQELVEKTRMLLADEALRKKIGALARREALRSHTWFARIFQVLPRVEELQRSLVTK